MTLLIVFAAFWLAWSNGANDNFKGVATLYGSGTASFRAALLWSAASTLAGSLFSMISAEALVKTFSGSGLVPDELTMDPALLTAVGGAGAATILLATLLGMPTSTTHALTGALIGAALASGSTRIDWTVLVEKFAQPLLLSPVLAILGTVVLVPILRRLHMTGVPPDTCICIAGEPRAVPVFSATSAAFVPQAIDFPSLRIDRVDACRTGGRTIGFGARGLIDFLHYLSAGAVCFARAVNDTPKVAALLLATGGGNAPGKLGLVATAMVLGGLLQSKKVARTMSERITKLNPGQGLTANLVTAALVLGASAVGLPVSTTHVSCGSIFGIGLVERRRNWRTIGQIILTWLTTLPLGLALGALIYWTLNLVRT